MSFKSFDFSTDVTTIVSSVNELVNMSSSLYSGSTRTKTYTNITSGTGTPLLGGYFQTTYDAAPSLATSSPLVDWSFGYSDSTAFPTETTTSSSHNEKLKVYRQMANQLLGSHDARFTLNGLPVDECFFILPKRNIQKDEIKKGTTAVRFYNGNFLTGSDWKGASEFKQTLGGDYSPLLSGSTEVGQVWYNAGVIVLGATASWATNTVWSGSTELGQMISDDRIDRLVDGVRQKVANVSFQNQTNLYSTIYFCRAFNNEFNYSSNPTFVDENKRIRVTSGSNVLSSRTYVTTVGLYDANDNLLGVAKVNKPLTKTPDSELVLRVRCDF